MTGYNRIIIAFLLAFSHSVLNGQTCCSGGVPVSANLGFASADQGTVIMSANVDFNILKSLYTGSRSLEDNLRKRTTTSYLFRASYSLSNRAAIEGFFSVVRQTREIYTNQSSTDFESTFGLGNPVFLLIYNVIQDGFTWRIGAGPQIPLGASDRKNDMGLFLVEDLQPGSGSWDIILFSSFEFPLRARPSGLFYLNSLISQNGTNPDSRGGNQSYKFGNDIQVIGGYGDQVLIANQIITPGIGLRYRTAGRDRIDGFPNSGTGGKFIFLRVSNGMALPRDMGNFILNVELPIYIHVNETQLAPTFVFNLGWSHTFSARRKNTRSFQNLEP
jgi:hypothetical protein